MCPIINTGTFFKPNSGKKVIGMERKTKLTKLALGLFEGKNNREILQELGIPRRTFFRWKKRMQAEGLSTLMNKKTPGRKPFAEIDDNYKNKILSWRKKFGWGPTKIEGHLKIHFGKKIPHNTIYKFLKENNLNQALNRERRTWGKTRFERMHSNSLWQADYKLLETDYWMITFIDDHSRFITASNIFWSPNSENALATLVEATQDFGNPEQILTDRGTQFYNNRGNGKSEFSLFCSELGIEHIVASKRRPTTTGKVENFHGCYEKEAFRFSTHEKFIRYWNYKRPNGAINYKFPSEVYFRDLKECH